MTQFKNIIILVLLVSCIVLGWLYWQAQGSAMHEMNMSADTDMPTDGKNVQTSPDNSVLYWYDPMRPEVQFDEPGKSPFMDMQLVPKYAGVGGSSEISIDPAMVQNLGMRTATVERGSFWQRIDTVGRVEVDEHRIQSIESRASGWVERLTVRAVGDPVRRGQSVAEIYAPDIYAAQKELLLAQHMNDDSLLEAARERLLLLNVSPVQIKTILNSGEAQRRLHIAAPGNGIVTTLHAREGDMTGRGKPLMHIADLSQVWMIAEIPESQAGWIAPGRPVEARLTALPGELYEGTVDYIYPELEQATRSLRVRLVFDNPSLVLKPGMYADITLFGGARRDVLLLPSEAVIRTGERELVMLALEPGRYKPVAIRTGGERVGRTVVLSGLQAGDEVVTSGQFLIDSEASLQGVYQRSDQEMASPMEAQP